MPASDVRSPNVRSPNVRPPPCGPPPCCGPNPLSAILSGAFKLVTGVLALPFKVADCIANQFTCRPPCGPRPMAAVCCQPPVCCAPPACGPMMGVPGPGMGFGMGGPAPMGFGRGVPKRFSPMTEHDGSFDMNLLSSANQGFFGAYW